MEKTKILFVCLGNICRSPSAEAVFRAYVNKIGLSGTFEIDSAGTSVWHLGEKADHRMQTHASKRGYQLTSISRKFNPESDFNYFDLIIGMDNQNIVDLKKLARNEHELQKIHKITDYNKEWNYKEVPDPYYGGEDGFELVLDLLEDASKGLLEKLLV